MIGSVVGSGVWLVLAGLVGSVRSGGGSVFCGTVVCSGSWRFYKYSNTHHHFVHANILWRRKGKNRARLVKSSKLDMVCHLAGGGCNSSSTPYHIVALYTNSQI